MSLKDLSKIIMKNCDSSNLGLPTGKSLVLPKTGNEVFIDVSKVPKLERSGLEYCGKCDAVRDFGYFKSKDVSYKVCSFCGDYIEI